MRKASAREVEKALQRRLPGQLRGLTQQHRGAAKLGLVLDAVRDGSERRRTGARFRRPWRPPDRGEEAGRGCASLAGERIEPGLDSSLVGTVGIEIARFRLRRRSGNEHLVVIEPGPGPLVDEEIVQPRFSLRLPRIGSCRPFGHRRVRKILEHRVVARPHLPEKQAVHQFRRFNQLRERPPLAFWKSGHVGADLGGCEPGGHGPQIGKGRRRIGHGMLIFHEGISGRRAQPGGGKGDDDDGGRQHGRAEGSVSYGFTACAGHGAVARRRTRDGTTIEGL